MGICKRYVLAVDTDDESAFGAVSWHFGLLLASAWMTYSVVSVDFCIALIANMN